MPEDAQSGDCFILTLTVRDDAEAVMTRYAQLMVTVADGDSVYNPYISPVYANYDGMPPHAYLGKR